MMLGVLKKSENVKLTPPPYVTFPATDMMKKRTERPIER